MISIEYILLGIAVLLLVSIFASKASGRVGVPALLLFLAVGMLAGSEGPGRIDFDNAYLAQTLGVVALVFILFAGGIETEWKSVRPVLGKALALSTVGVLLTALLVGLFAKFVLGFSFLSGVLLGAIVSSTDAAAVFVVLRSRSVSLKGQLRPLLELESGSNDPMAVFLTIGLTSLLANPSYSLVSLVPMFFQQMAVGGLLGYALGRGMALVINRIRLEYEGLYTVLLLALVMLTYGASSSLGGNGFLAVYLSGLVLGRYDFIHKQSLIRFHDGVAWLMQIAMFLTLGLLVFPSRLLPVMGTGLLVSLFLMLVARPVSVFLTMYFTDLKWRELLMISWVGLRGAVPIILATFPLLGGVPHAEVIFNLVFFIVITSVLLQGTTLPLVARLLKVDAPMEIERPLELVDAEGLKARSKMVEIRIPGDSPATGKQIVELGLPKEALVLLIDRGDEFLMPRGSTQLEAGDTMLLLADKHSRDEVRDILGSPHRTETGAEEMKEE